jgi:hypothetical protein
MARVIQRMPSRSPLSLGPAEPASRSEGPFLGSPGR